MSLAAGSEAAGSGAAGLRAAGLRAEPAVGEQPAACLLAGAEGAEQMSTWEEVEHFPLRLLSKYIFSSHQFEQSLYIIKILTFSLHFVHTFRLAFFFEIFFDKVLIFI